MPIDINGDYYDSDDPWPVIRSKKKKVSQTKKLGNITKFLVLVLESIGPDQISQLPQDIQDWWEEHEEEEKKKIEKSKIQQQIKDLRKQLKDIK